MPAPVKPVTEGVAASTARSMAAILERIMMVMVMMPALLMLMI